MDVHKKRIDLVIMTRERMLRRVNLPYDPYNLLSYVLKKHPDERVLFAYEAGPTGYGIYDFLIENGQDCVIAVPSMIPQSPGGRVKTNRLDAYQLGVELPNPNLRLVEVPEKKYRDLRHLTRLRLRYGKGLVATKNRLKGIYLFEGIKFPEGRWTRKTIAQLAAIEYRPAVKYKIAQYLSDFEYYKKQEQNVRAEIRRFCKADQELNTCTQILMSIPGFKWIISTYVLGCLGGWKHLSSVKKTSGFLGFGASEHSTGEKTNRGRITAVGDPNARKMIIQSSWVAISKSRDSELRQIYDRIYSRNDKKTRRQKAIVAVGRHQMVRVHALLRDQRFFEKKSRMAAT